MRDDDTVNELTASITVCVVGEQGLHARPAAKVAQTAQGFASDVFLSVGSQKVNAKSILDILLLAAGQGTMVELSARGPDADAAVDALVELFKNRFS